jgi:single-stranded-DNA-specific exonuclease
MQWSLKSSTIPSSLNEVENILLKNRGIEDASAFFNPLHPVDLKLKAVGIDPKQMRKATMRLDQALKNQEDVLVFGDYDADGICSTAVLWLTLHNLGYKARPFIPHREKHGYGLSQKALDDILAAQKPDLIVTVDNGIVAHEAVARLNQVGVDVIITDHHQPEESLPPALAIVHTTQLCGTTVAWMLAREIDSEFVKSTLDLCGIATIADQVPLLQANRSFAYWGIEALKKTERVGLKQLCQVAELTMADLSTSSVNFGLAPRINAMGRLDHGLDALRLLCTSNPQRAQELVENLNYTNLRRQDLTESMVATAQAEAQTWVNEHIIVAYSTEYHEGVIGLIAGKLMEEFYKPAIVIAVGERVAKASARSIPGVNIVELIRQVRDDLLEVGGHPMAAGFGLLPEKIEVVKQLLQELARTQISSELLTPSIQVECELPFGQLSDKLVKLTETFEPFGQANPEPVFGLKQLKVVEAQAMGRDKKHLKLSVTTGDLKPLTCIAWNRGFLAPKLEAGTIIDVAGVIEISEWNNRKTLQLKAKDIVIASS